MSLGKILIDGIYTNIKRILFASDRVTDMEIRNAALTGTVAPPVLTEADACIGCSVCSMTCPTKCITMVPLDPPVQITETMVKKAQPEIDETMCVHCYYCHDACPVFKTHGVAAPIHPNDVGVKCDTDLAGLYGGKK